MAVSLTLTDFDLPQPPAAIVHRNRLLYQERHGYDMSRLVATLEGYSSLNDDQRAVFDRVRASLDAYEAGTLSQGGTTGHSRFKVPFELDANTPCRINRKSDTAHLIKAADLG
ncbi:hypothetical protein WJX79_008413 [Trebouxia sp. C0005]